MKKRFFRIAAVVIAILTITLAAVFHFTSGGPLRPETIHSQLYEMESATRESSLLIDQYTQGKITKAYFIMQLDQLDKKMLSLTDSVEESELPTGLEPSVKKATDIASRFLFIVKRIEQTDDRKKIKKEIRSVNTLTSEIVKLNKMYE